MVGASGRGLCYLVYVCGALSEDGADSRGQAQLHQALQLCLGIRLHLISGLFQRAAVYQGETPGCRSTGEKQTSTHCSHPAKHLKTC